MKISKNFIIKKKVLIVIYFFGMLILNSCAYTNLPFTYKLTRGDWKSDTIYLEFNQLPVKVRDTLASFYQDYYSGVNNDFSDLISLNSDVEICLKHNVTFPPEGFFQISGYHFSIGSKKYFFDYGSFRTPIVYLNNTLYYFSGMYTVKSDRYTFEAQSDFRNKIFVKYLLDDSNLRKHRKKVKGECRKTSKYNFINKISRFN